MKLLTKKWIVYLLVTMMAVPTIFLTSIAGAKPAMASGIDTQDFGVMQASEVNGYSVGFGLIGMTASDLISAEVKLYNGEILLSTNTATGLMANFPAATSLSSPFNINGYFDYGIDGNWLNSGWNGTVLDVPTKAVVSITDNLNNVYTAEYGAPTGSPVLLRPNDYVEPASLATVQPDVFGTMRFSGVSGYTVGFGLVTYTASQLKKIEIKLYDGADNLLATTISNRITTQYPTATSLSAPFDINGTFDYAADGSWNYSGWNGTLTDIPIKAVIKVTDKMDNTYTVENNTLTGAPLPYVAAQDFGVMQQSDVNGYTVGFGFVNDMDSSDLTSIKVDLYENDTLLGETNATGDVFALNATDLSSPFDVSGTFDYVADGFWNYSGWLMSAGNVPTKAVITVVDSLGCTYTVTNSNLSGDPILLLPAIPATPAISVTAGDGKSVNVDFKGVDGGVVEYKVFVNGILTKTIAVDGNDFGIDYHVNVPVGSYGTYNVYVMARNSGNGMSQSITRSFALVAPASATVPVRHTSVPSSFVAPETAQVATTGPAPATSVPSVDEQGQIKGEETAETTDNGKINWTPWIILFILILLAGAATGGYFYWFGGDNEAEGATVAVKEKKIEEPKAAVAKKPASGTNKKSRRW